MTRRGGPIDIECNAVPLGAQQPSSEDLAFALIDGHDARPQFFHLPLRAGGDGKNQQRRQGNARNGSDLKYS